VDVVFLTELFPDFVVPRLTSIRGTLAIAFVLREALEKVFISPQPSSDEAFARVIVGLSNLSLPTSTEAIIVRGDFGHPPFRSWLDRVNESTRDTDSKSAKESMTHFKTMYLARISDVGGFMKSIYPAVDEVVASEMNDVLEKTLAMSLGAQLAFLYLAAKSGSSMDTDPELIFELRQLLTEGI
jgi:hypothetical protein